MLVFVHIQGQLLLNDRGVPIVACRWHYGSIMSQAPLTSVIVSEGAVMAFKNKHIYEYEYAHVYTTTHSVKPSQHSGPRGIQTTLDISDISLQWPLSAYGGNNGTCLFTAPILF